MKIDRALKYLNPFTSTRGPDGSAAPRPQQTPRTDTALTPRGALKRTPPSTSVAETMAPRVSSNALGFLMHRDRPTETTTGFVQAHGGLPAIPQPKKSVGFANTTAEGAKVDFSSRRLTEAEINQLQLNDLPTDGPDAAAEKALKRGKTGVRTSLSRTETPRAATGMETALAQGVQDFLEHASSADLARIERAQRKRTLPQSTLKHAFSVARESGTEIGRLRPKDLTPADRDTILKSLERYQTLTALKAMGKLQALVIESPESCLEDIRKGRLPQALNLGITLTPARVKEVLASYSASPTEFAEEDLAVIEEARDSILNAAENERRRAEALAMLAAGDDA